MPFVQAKRIIFGVTVAVWLGVCAVVLWRLMRRAADAQPAAIEEYARAPSVQVLNFVIGYLPSLALPLVALLAVEYLALRVAERSRKQANKI